MKKILLPLFLCLLNVVVLAQGVFNNQTNSTLIKVVQDYPSQFKNIKGELLVSKAGTAEYKSTIAVPGAVSTIITQSEGANQAVSWQSVLYSGNAFIAARNRFEELYNQIKNTIIKPEGEKAAIVNGMFVNPSEDKAFTTVQFGLMPPTGVMQKVNIDLVLKNTGQEWIIVLNVYDKDIKEASSLTSK